MAPSNAARVLVVIVLLAVQTAAMAGLGGGRLVSTGVYQQLVPAWPFAQEIPESAVDYDLRLEIEARLTGLVGTYGVAVRNLDDGRIVRVNADEQLEAASMYKLLVMYRVLQQVEAGEIQLSNAITIQEADTVEAFAPYDLSAGEVVTVEDALKHMISMSSNSAAYALSRTVGGWSVVDSAAREIGMLDTHWDEGYWSTPDDIMHYFEELADRRLVSREASNQMVEILLQQSIADRIPALLPEEVKVAHKTGELDNVRNDGGIVSTPRGRYVIVVMSYGVDPAEATELIAELSRMACCLISRSYRRAIVAS